MIRTPIIFERYFYAGFNHKARILDELLGISIARYYLGIYPTRLGFEVTYGRVNDHGGLVEHKITASYR